MKAFRFGFIALLGVLLLLRLLIQNRNDPVNFASNYPSNGLQDRAVPSSLMLLQPVSENGQDDGCIKYLIQDKVISEGQYHLNIQVHASTYLAHRQAQVQMRFREVGVSEIMIGVLDDVNQPHYVPLYNSYLDGLGWRVIERGGVSLYQRTNPPPSATYGSIQEFLDQLGSNQVPGVIAVYGYPATASLLPLERALALDAVGVDYIVAHYNQPERSGGKYIAHQTLDIPEGSVANDILHVVLTVSGPQGNSAQLILDSLVVELECQ